MGEQRTGEYDPLIIFVEGGTTNGQYLIKFKKGAFAGLNAIQPQLIKYHSFFQQSTTGVTDGAGVFIVSACLPFSWTETITLPIFTPNEYFFSHHQEVGEEKWQTYARVVREIMAEVGGYETVD